MRPRGLEKAWEVNKWALTVTIGADVFFLYFIFFLHWIFNAALFRVIYLTHVWKILSHNSRSAKRVLNIGPQLLCWLSNHPSDNDWNMPLYQSGSVPMHTPPQAAHQQCSCSLNLLHQPTTSWRRTGKQDCNKVGSGINENPREQKNPCKGCQNRAAGSGWRGWSFRLLMASCD